MQCISKASTYAYAKREDLPPIYGEGVMLTYDHGSQLYAAWLQRVLGDALVHKGMSQAETIGGLVEAIMGFCQLCTQHLP